MPKNLDFVVGPEITDIMEKLLKKFPDVFPGFDVNAILCSHNTGKTNESKPLKLTPVRYPHSICDDHVYIVQAADDTWKTMDQKQKNLAVFHIMCSIPDGAFDPESKEYGKKRKPDFELFVEEYAASGGILDWMQNPKARDPLDIVSKKSPVTPQDVTSS